MSPIVSCPTCQQAVEWKPENRWRPFCSERCKQIDLGAWAEEKYTIPATNQPDTDSQPDLPELH